MGLYARGIARSNRRRHGLTLLELVVVLTILVAVTGLVVPLLPSFMHRANIASCTTNISELDKLIQTYQSMDRYGHYPDKMDNLVVEGNTPDYVLDGTTGEFGKASFSAGTLEPTELAALNEAGINNVAILLAARPASAPGEWKPTAWPYNTAGEATTSAEIHALGGTGGDTSVAVLTPLGAKLMGLPTTESEKYVIFGLNKPCTLFRNMASEPPYHFADTPSEDPATYYMPFAVVFMVSKTVDGVAGTALEKAKFMGSVAFHDFGLATADSHTKEWWEQAKADGPAK
jgi:type II secretory pathway pseudopilin PulG